MGVVAEGLGIAAFWGQRSGREACEGGPVGKVVRLHEGLRALYPDAVVFGGIGTTGVVRELDRIRALLGHSAMTGDLSALSIAVSGDGLVIWAESPVLTLRPGQLAAICIDDGAMDVTAVVAGRTAAFTVPLANAAETPNIADRVLVAIAGRSA